VLSPRRQPSDAQRTCDRDHERGTGIGSEPVIANKARDIAPTGDRAETQAKPPDTQSQDRVGVAHGQLGDTPAQRERRHRVSGLVNCTTIVPATSRTGETAHAYAPGP
jgi:hypothetical protein